MKRLLAILCLLALLLAPGLAVAGPYLEWTALDAQASTGAGIVKGLGTWYKTFTCEATITGGPTAVTVSLQGSLRGLAFEDLPGGEHAFTAGELTTGFAFFTVNTVPILHTQGYLDTLTGGSSPTVTMYCIGVKE